MDPSKSSELIGRKKGSPTLPLSGPKAKPHRKKKIKTHAILQTCGKLDLLASERGLPSPVLRAAPTGVAAFGFFGRTLHTSFRLPVRGSTWELSVADLTGLQARFKDVKYLIVDEKSMVDLKTLGIIDERLREIFPDKNMLPFGSLNVVVTGDNWQLQPVATVGGHPLFRGSGLLE